MLYKKYNNNHTEKKSTWEVTVKDNTNAIDTMLFLQKADMPASNRSSSLPAWYDDEKNMDSNVTHEQDSDEQALATVGQCIKFFGQAATKEIEEHMEYLQEEFLNHLEDLLQSHNINIQEKLTISLSSDNQLILQCQEEEDALLSTLGTDELLLKHLHSLRKAALVSRGLDFILSVQNQNHSDNLPQYRVCTKGALSHFYLK